MNIRTRFGSYGLHSDRTRSAPDRHLEDVIDETLGGVAETPAIRSVVLLLTFLNADRVVSIQFHRAGALSLGLDDELIATLVSA
jgi:hypothetical protein